MARSSRLAWTSGRSEMSIALAVMAALLLTVVVIGYMRE